MRTLALISATVAASLVMPLAPVRAATCVKADAGGDWRFFALGTKANTTITTICNLSIRTSGKFDVSTCSYNGGGYLPVTGEMRLANSDLCIFVVDINFKNGSNSHVQQSSLDMGKTVFTGLGNHEGTPFIFTMNRFK